VLYANNIPISGQTDFRESKAYKEKTTLPRARADVADFGCVAALVTEVTISVSRFGNINPIPFREYLANSYACTVAGLICYVLNGFRRSLRAD
jgi:hypothetical protein